MKITPPPPLPIDLRGNSFTFNGRTLAYTVEDMAARDAQWAALIDALPAGARAGDGIPAGYKLVPLEPTREMWAAVNKLDDEMAAGAYDGKGCTIEQAWNCMLAAAPAAAPAEPHDSRGPTTLEGWRSAALAGEKERDWLRERLQTVDRHQGKDCWYWQSDGEDHLESMTNALPVVIRADHLRKLLAAAPALSAPAGVIERIESAMKRIEDGHGIRRIPAEPTDPDLVLAECKALLEGRWPPFWIKGAAGAAIQAPATAPQAEPDHDAWQCDRCNGDGWHWVEREGVEWRDSVRAKEHCEQCDGLGWLGPDAVKAANALKGQP